ncbi:MAG TPA: DNA primase, partial [Polyangiaceae bacterium]
KRGRSWLGLCPFHKEKTPSFNVNPDRGFFHCFGCGESGSAIDFLMKHDGLTFPEAVRDLAERCGITIEEETRPSTEVDRQKRAREDLYSAMSVAAGFYEKMLREHPDRAYALEELDKRGLLPVWAKDGGGEPGAVEDALQAFRIGYAPAEWDSLAHYLRDQGISPATAEAVGLLAPRQGGTGHYDRFRHRLMFAVVDVQGRVVAFSGRALRDKPDAKPGDPPPKYINSPESPIYTKGALLFGLFQARHAIRQDELAILVEGNFDVVSLHARGIANVVAPLGTAFTAEQAKLLKRYTGDVVLCFDGDAAGRKATRASKEPCREAGLTARVAIMPQGVDPDLLVRTKGAEGVKDVVERAQGMFEFLIEDALNESFMAADAYERAARVQQISRLLSEEDDPLVRSMMKTHVDRVAGRLDLINRAESGRGVHSPEIFRALGDKVSRDLMAARARDAQREHARGAQGVTGTDPRRARVSGTEPGKAARGEIVGAFIDFPELLDEEAMTACLDLLEGDASLTVAALRACTKTTPSGEKSLDSTAFLAQMPPAIQSFAARRLAAPRLDTVEDAREAVLSNAEKLKSMMADRDTDELVKEQLKATDWETQMDLAREADERVRSGGKGGGRVS